MLLYYAGKNVSFKWCESEAQLVELVADTPSSVGIVFSPPMYPVLRYKIRDNNVWDIKDLYPPTERFESGPFSPSKSEL